MRQAVSILEVGRPEIWDELEAVAPMGPHTASVLGPLRRVVRHSFHREILPLLRKAGLAVLVRYARRSSAEIEASRAEHAHRLHKLSDNARRILHNAQRHALDEVVLGSLAWDPVEDVRAVNALHGAGLIEALPTKIDRGGSYRLHPDLPPPPRLILDVEEAMMPEPEDLAQPLPGPVQLLHDLASFTAALSRHRPRRTHAGTLDRATTRKLGRHLASAELARSGDLSAAPRWERALRALEALGAVLMDPATRVLSIEPGLETLLEGDTAEAVDRLIHRLVDRNLQAGLPLLRDALSQVGAGCLDEMILFELLAEQQREALVTPWLREGALVYPAGDHDIHIPYDEQGFERIDQRMYGDIISTLIRLGLVRRAPGVIAPTEEGRLWASGRPAERPPIWVSSDLELIVPPGAVTPWERYQLERLGRCLSRDVVDRYRLERVGLAAWLATHELSEAIDLLTERAPGLPNTVRQTLEAWAADATRVVLTRGVLLEPHQPL